MKVLITGGSGMVGQNLLNHQGLKDFEKLAPTSSELNLLDRNSVSNYLKSHQPELIIHCAGRVGGIQANIKNPTAFLSENLEMGLNLLLSAQKNKIKKLINLGSSCMYPRDATNPLKEIDVLRGELEPTNEGYAIAKCAISRLCDYISREDNSYMYKTIIPCNLYGRWDKFAPHNSHLIPAIIAKITEAIEKKQEIVEIWGDGNSRREFMFADDLADFIEIAVMKIQDLDQLTNVGLGFDYSINEYYQAVARALSYKGSFKHDLTKPTGMKQKLVDITRAKKLGWKAKTDLDLGINKTIEYFMIWKKENL
jgi:GDP-L-fucose synthase